MGILIFLPVIVLFAIMVGSVFYGLRDPPKSPGRWLPFFFEALAAPAFILPVSVALLSGKDIGIPFIPPFWAGVIGVFLGLAGGSLGVGEVITNAKRRARLKGWWKSELAALPLSIPLFLLSAAVFVVALTIGTSFGASLAAAPDGSLRPAANEELKIIAPIVMGAEISIFAVIAFWACCVYVLTPRRLSEGSKLDRILDGVGEVTTAVGFSIGQIVAFVTGGLWLILATLLIYYAWRPEGPIGWLVVALGVVALGKGLSEIGSMLRGRDRLENQGAHGNAATATEEQASAHERGDASQTPLHRQRF